MVQEKKGGLDSKILDDKRVSAAIVLFSTALQAMALSPLFMHGTAIAGDGYLHLLRAEGVYIHILQGKPIFGYYEIFQTGQPLLNIYQPLFYLLVAVIKLFSHLSVLDAFKAVFGLSLICYPLSVFVFMRCLGYRPVTCGFASLFPVISNLGWGNNITTYFTFGIVTQALGMLFFPLALGFFIKVVREGRFFFRTVLLTLLLLLSHLLMTYMFFIISVVSLCIMCLDSKSGEVQSVIKRAMMLYLAFALASSFWSLPLMSLSGYNSSISGEQAPYSTVQKGGLSPVYAFFDFVTSRLLDNPGGRQYGLGWSMAVDDVRFPTFTLLTLIGLFSACRVKQSQRNLLLCGGFVFTFFYVCGSDDVFVLKLIPFNSLMFHIRGLAVFEFFCACLAGVGCARLLEFVSFMLARMGATKTNTLAALAIALVLFSYSAVERVGVADKVVNAGMREKLTDISGVYEDERISPDGRGFVYFRGKNNADTSQFLMTYGSKKGFITGISRDPRYLTQQVLEQYQRNSDFMDEFVGNLHMLDLYDVNSVISNADLGWVESLDLVGGRGLLRVYEKKQKTGYFQIADVKPVLGVIGNDDVFFMETMWLGYYSREGGEGGIPFLASPKGNALLNSLPDARMFSGIFLSNDASISQATASELKKEFMKNGLPVFEGEVNESVVFKPKNVESIYREGFAVNYERESSDGLELSCRLEEPRFIVLKKSGFPGWEVYVDGKKTLLYETGPGFVGFFAGRGEHVIKTRYELPYRSVGLALSVLGLVFAAFASRRLG